MSEGLTLQAPWGPGPPGSPTQDTIGYKRNHQAKTEGKPQPFPNRGEANR